MTMFVDVTANSELIARAEIVNETGGTDADSVNTYRWTYDGESGRHLEDTVQHRYGDGAIVLAHLVVAAVAARYYVANVYTRDLESFTPDSAEAFLRTLARNEGDGLDIGTLAQVHRRVTRRLQTPAEWDRIQTAATVLRAAGRL